MEKVEKAIRVELRRRGEYVDVFEEGGKLLASFLGEISRRQYKQVVDAMQWVVEQGPYVI